MSQGKQDSRAALRARQGSGARYDAEDAPHSDLLLARRATAYFARKLNELSDADLYSPSQREGWSRAHVVSAVAYDARRLALRLELLWPDTCGLSPEILDDLPALALAATLPPRALRHLFEHSTKHLDVVWRDLPGPGWADTLELDNRGEASIRELPFRRAVTLWRHSLLLADGIPEKDVPEAIRPVLESA